MAKIRRSKIEKTDKTDLEYYRGLVRQLQKKLASLEKENSRLSKAIRNEVERLYDSSYEEDDVFFEPVEEFSGKPDKWKCKKCKHTECAEMVLPQGLDIIKIYLTCKQCGHREKKETRA